ILRVVFMSLPQLLAFVRDLVLGILRLDFLVVGAREHERELGIGARTREHHLGTMIVVVRDQLLCVLGLILRVLQVKRRFGILFGTDFARAPYGGRGGDFGFFR